MRRMTRVRMIATAAIVAIMVVTLTAIVYAQAAAANTAVEKDWLIGMLCLILAGLLSLLVHQHIATDKETARIANETQNRVTEHDGEIHEIREILHRIEEAVSGHKTKET